jgi:hypothetical protein
LFPWENKKEDTLKEKENLGLISSINCGDDNDINEDKNDENCYFWYLKGHWKINISIERKVKKLKKETHQEKNLQPSWAAGLYQGEETWEGLSAIRVHSEKGESMAFLRLGVLNILWGKEGGWRGMGIRCNGWERGWGEVLDISREVIRIERVYVLLSWHPSSSDIIIV